jgi:hypothetical protein
MIAVTLALSLRPIIIFFFHCHIKLDWIKANDFQLRTAIFTFDDIALIGILINLDVRVAFGTRSSWHVPLFLRHRKTFFHRHAVDSARKYLNRNRHDLQEA